MRHNSESSTQRSLPDSPRQPNLARHQQRCTVCRHPDRAAIEELFLHWFNPEDIAGWYDLPDPFTLRPLRCELAEGLTLNPPCPPVANEGTPVPIPSNVAPGFSPAQPDPLVPPVPRSPRPPEGSKVERPTQKPPIPRSANAAEASPKPTAGRAKAPSAHPAIADGHSKEEIHTAARAAQQALGVWLSRCGPRLHRRQLVQEQALIATETHSRDRPTD